MKIWICGIAAFVSSIGLAATPAQVAPSATATSQPIAVDPSKLAISGLTNDASRRYLMAASFFRNVRTGEIIGYDLLSRCGVIARYQTNGQNRKFVGSLVDVQQARPGDTAPRLVAASYQDVAALANGASGQGTCLRRINELFGSSFEAQARQRGAIARHAIAVLQGADVSGPNSTALPVAQRATSYARERVGSKIGTPVYLGSLSSAQGTLVVIGEPNSLVRWVAQYGNLAPNQWRFEGALDVDLEQIK